MEIPAVAAALVCLFVYAFFTKNNDLMTKAGMGLIAVPAFMSLGFSIWMVAFVIFGIWLFYGSGLRIIRKYIFKSESASFEEQMTEAKELRIYECLNCRGTLIRKLHFGGLFVVVVGDEEFRAVLDENEDPDSLEVKDSIVVLGIDNRKRLVIRRLYTEEDNPHVFKPKKREELKPLPAVVSAEIDYAAVHAEVEARNDSNNNTIENLDKTYNSIMEDTEDNKDTEIKKKEEIVSE